MKGQQVRVGAHRPALQIAHVGDKVSSDLRNALIDLAIRTQERRAWMDREHEQALRWDLAIGLAKRGRK